MMHTYKPNLYYLLNTMTETLSIDQRYAFSRFQSGNNVFVTGPGGTGKTRFIKHLVEHMRETGKKHQVCALTGCAAILLNCGAKTIHSWSGIRLGRGKPADILTRIMKNRYLTKAWREIQVLVIDEISMMSAKLFELLDLIAKAIRRSIKPFGGIQLVVTGDFFQLPPIPDASDPLTSAFCFESAKWTTIFSRENCIQLTTYFRQTDPLYISILEEVRLGNLSESNAAILQKHVNRAYVPQEHGGIIPTKLFPIRQKVDFVNTTMYAKLAGDEFVYKYEVKDECMYAESGKPIPIELIERCKELSVSDRDFEIEQLLSTNQIEKTIRLKVGASVMCTTNLNMDAGICNGSQGIVTGFGESGFPTVHFSNGRTIRIEPHVRQCEEYPCIAITQLPLCLAWALTIHKIQGATLDMAEMDIGMSVFEYGQTYVALSRIKTLDGLYLSEFQSHRIKANPNVVAFYACFPKRSREEMEEALKSKPKENAVLEEEPYLDPNIKRIRL